MGVEFRLVLAGDPAVDEVAARTAATPQPTSNPRLSTARLYDQRGYAVTVRPGTHGYYEADTDDEARWEWEPDTYVNVTFSTRPTTWPTREYRTCCQRWPGTAATSATSSPTPSPAPAPSALAATTTAPVRGGPSASPPLRVRVRPRPPQQGGGNEERRPAEPRQQPRQG